jgi:hypothetical protein
MSLLNFGPGVNDMRKSIGSTVYARNRGGAYARNRTFPTQPNTAAQIAQRNIFGDVSASWKTLTEAQRKAWINAATDFPYIDVFGNEKKYSGSVLFQKLNVNLTIIGSTTLTLPPIPIAFRAISTFTINTTADPETLPIFSSPGTTLSDTKLIIYGTDTLSPGISFAKKYFRLIDVLPVSTNYNATDIFAAWSAVFGSFVSGQKIFVKIIEVSTSSGQTGVPRSNSDIVT